MRFGECKAKLRAKIKYKRCFKCFISLIQCSENEVQFTQKANRFVARPKRRMIVKYTTSHKH
jgi:hypothetical protein